MITVTRGGKTVTMTEAEFREQRDREASRCPEHVRDRYESNCPACVAIRQRYARVKRELGMRLRYR
jgi:hypothetical protein